MTDIAATPRTSPTTERLLKGLVVAVAVAPAVVAAVSVLGSGWVPSDDRALEILRISDVGGAHTPLVGAWSRWHWNHPGPLLFWIAAPLYRLIGDVGVLLTCALLAGASSAGVALLGLRRGGVVLGGITALLLAVVTGSLGLGTLVDPWNPFVALLPFLLFLFLVWSVLCDDLFLLPIAAAVGTFCMQAHAGYVPLVGGLGVVTLVGMGVRRAVAARRANRVDVDPAAGPARTSASEASAGDAILVRRPRRRVGTAGRAAGVRASVHQHRLLTWTVASIAVLAALWAPAVYDQVAGTGNLGRLVDFSRNPTEAAVGWPDAFGIMSMQLGVPAPWMDANDTLLIGLARTAPVAVGVAALTVLAAVTALAFRRERIEAGVLGAVALAAVATGLASTARITGIVFPYLVRWWWMISAFALLAVVWGLLAAFGLQRRRAVGVATLALAALVATGVVWRDMPVTGPNPRSSESLSELIDDTSALLDPDGRYVVRASDQLNLGGAGPSLLLGLEQRGFQVFVEPDDLTDSQYGGWRTLPASEADGVVTVVGLDVIDAGWEVPAGAQQIAIHDPLSPAERQEFADLQRSMRSVLGDVVDEGVVAIVSPYVAVMAQQRGARAADIERMKELQERGSGFAVYLEPRPDS